MNTETTTAFVALGSNLGDRAGNLLLAVRGLIEASFVVNKLSAVYETEPIDVEESQNFLNMVAEIRVTNITSSQMMARLLRIEYLLGRRDKMQKKPRTADLDILLFGNEIINTPFLTLPHPRMHLRRFVLTPLAEIAPTLVHPVLGLTVSEILNDLEDDSEVVRWEPHIQFATVESLD